MTPEKKLTIITGVFIGLVVVFGGVAIWWLQFEKLAEEEKTLDLRKKELGDRQNKQKELTELRRKKDELPQTVARQEKRIPTLPSGTWDPHRKHFYMLRKRCGVSLERDNEQQIVRRPGQGAGGPGMPDEAAFELTIKGGFSNIGRFIHMLEHGDPIMVVDAFTIKGRRSSTGVALKELKIRVKTYGFPPEPPKKTPPGK